MISRLSSTAILQISLSFLQLLHDALTPPEKNQALRSQFHHTATTIKQFTTKLILKGTDRVTDCGLSQEDLPGRNGETPMFRHCNKGFHLSEIGNPVHDNRPNYYSDILCQQPLCQALQLRNC